MAQLSTLVPTMAYYHNAIEALRLRLDDPANYPYVPGQPEEALVWDWDIQQLQGEWIAHLQGAFDQITAEEYVRRRVAQKTKLRVVARQEIIKEHRVVRIRVRMHPRNAQVLVDEARLEALKSEQAHADAIASGLGLVDHWSANYELRNGVLCVSFGSYDKSARHDSDVTWTAFEPTGLSLRVVQETIAQVKRVLPYERTATTIEQPN